MSLSSLLVFYHDQIGHGPRCSLSTQPAAAGIHVRTTCSNIFLQENHFVWTSVVSDVFHKGLDDCKDWQL